MLFLFGMTSPSLSNLCGMGALVSYYWAMLLRALATSSAIPTSLLNNYPYLEALQGYEKCWGSYEFYQRHLWIYRSFPGGFSSKESACKSRRCRFDSWVGKIPWRSKWQPTPVFLPRKSHGQRSLVGYSPWGHKRVRHNLETKQQQIALVWIWAPTQLDVKQSLNLTFSSQRKKIIKQLFSYYLLFTSL